MPAPSAPWPRRCDIARGMAAGLEKCQTGAKRRLLLAEVRRAARLCRDGEMETRLRCRSRKLRHPCTGGERDNGKRRRQNDREVAMQRAEGAGLLLLRRVVRLRHRALIARRRVANREAAKVRARRKARRAERAGGKLQIKPENSQTGDKLTARRRLRAKAVAKCGHYIGNTARHFVSPGPILRRLPRAATSHCDNFADSRRPVAREPRLRRCLLPSGRRDVCAPPHRMRAAAWGSLPSLWHRPRLSPGAL